MSTLLTSRSFQDDAKNTAREYILTIARVSPVQISAPPLTRCVSTITILEMSITTVACAFKDAVRIGVVTGKARRTRPGT